jgi:dCMP deaminase
MDERLSQKDYFMNISNLVALRSPCLRRQVGAVAVDSNNRILSTGYNGPPKNMKHCTKNMCLRESSGVGLDKCLAVHAEINVLLQCSDVEKICTIYLTNSPCLNCIVILANTGCYEIVYREAYHGLEKVIYIWTELLRRKITHYTKAFV